MLPGFLGLALCCRLSLCFCLALILRFDSSEPLLLRLRSLALLFSVGCRFCLTLYLFFKSLLRSFCSLALSFGVGGRLCLALYLVSEPLLLRFHSLEFCFTISCFCLTLFLVFDGGQPLLLCFRSLEFCISIGFRFCLTLFLERCCSLLPPCFDSHRSLAPAPLPQP